LEAADGLIILLVLVNVTSIAESPLQSRASSSESLLGKKTGPCVWAGSDR